MPVAILGLTEFWRERKAISDVLDYDRVISSRNFILSELLSAKTHKFDLQCQEMSIRPLKSSALRKLLGSLVWEHEEDIWSGLSHSRSNMLGKHVCLVWQLACPTCHRVPHMFPLCSWTKLLQCFHNAIAPLASTSCACHVPCKTLNIP